MKALLFAALVMSMGAVSSAQAQQERSPQKPAFVLRQTSDHSIVRRIELVPDRGGVGETAPTRMAQARKWRIGEHMPSWRERELVNNYSSHRLFRPKSNEQWIRVRNDFILINKITGRVAGMVGER